MRVRVVPIGGVHDAVLETVGAAIRDQFPATVSTTQPIDIPESAYDASREQYRADVLLSALAAIDGDRFHVGVILKDVYYGDREYVFGLARPGGDAIVACDRLTASPDGPGTAEPAVVTSRLRKETVHEFGHVLGLSHCTTDDCVMSFSGDVPGIDRKRDSFCEHCRTTVEEGTRSSTDTDQPP